MPWAPDYVTLAELKSFLRITDAADDVELGFAITAASRAVDQHTNRQFGKAASAEVRYYGGVQDSYQGAVYPCDDLMDTTGLVVRGWNSATKAYDRVFTYTVDFAFAPTNNPAKSLPWEELYFNTSHFSDSSPYPGGFNGLQVTARWGWSAVPTSVKEATLLQAARIFTRRHSPYGVAGSPEMGNELRLLSKVDPDVAVILRPVKRVWAVAGVR